MTTSRPVPALFRVLRILAELQYKLSALAFLVLLVLSAFSLKSTHTMAFITLEANAPARGQLGTGQIDSLQSSRQPAIRYFVTKSSQGEILHHFVTKSTQQRVIYREHNMAKRLLLGLLGVNNSSLGRSSLALALFSALTGRLLSHMLRDMRLDTPFTDRNARRIRGLALLMIGIDVYEVLALNVLRWLVPAFPFQGGSAGTITRYIILDPSLGGFGSWKFGLVLLVIATVYQRGVEMAREAELTI